MSTLTDIEARHATIQATGRDRAQGVPYLDPEQGAQAHADRGTLLSLLREERTEAERLREALDDAQAEMRGMLDMAKQIIRPTTTSGAALDLPLTEESSCSTNS